MIEKIKAILLENNDVSAFKIVESKINSSELFFIKKEMHMDRFKNVHHFKVTVYRDFEEDGTSFRGSSTAKVHPTMSSEEIRYVIADAAYAAGFVRNPYYPLAKPHNTCCCEKPSMEEQASHEGSVAKLINAVFKNDNYSNGSINSCEFFLNNVFTRIINSEGVDVSFTGFKGQIEFITNWKEDAEEIELYKDLQFAEINEEDISSEVTDLLLKSKEKSVAATTPNLIKSTILLTGEPVVEFFKYYYSKANAQNVYSKLSNAKLEESIQGENISGDLVNILLDPTLDNSTNSEPYDEDGFPLARVSLVENGILKSYWGDIRHSYYLGVEPTGSIKNMLVQGGSKSVENMRNNPCLELAAFSDFQMDPLTGNFAGEIRLGWYFDGEKTIPVTGGSISGNVHKVQTQMYLSKEMQKANGFHGPKAIQLFDVAVAGI